MTPWSLPRRLAALALLALDALALALLAAYAGWAALPHFCGDVTAALRQAAPSRRYEDRHGTLLLLEPTRPDELRQDAPQSEIHAREFRNSPVSPKDQAKSSPYWPGRRPKFQSFPSGRRRFP